MSQLMSELLQSDTRAALLHLLLAENRAGTMSELARLAGVTPRSVAKEVQHLANLGLVKVDAIGSSYVVAAAWEHPACPLLAQLLTLQPAKSSGPSGAVREALKAFGAPLLGITGKAHFTVEEALLKGVEAAKTDGTVLRVLPVVIAKNSLRLDWRLLTEMARKARLKAELGFVLELTGNLLADEDLVRHAQSLRDRRRKGLRFFTPVNSKYERKLAEEASPGVARSWGFLVNMSEESFRSLLVKSCPELRVV